nr:hypothetical protein BaRGS_024611 [Batillaria attramentaria]
MKMYTGKDGNKQEVGQGADVEKEVMTDYTHKDHTIYINSFFTNAAVVEYLHKRDTSACVTVNKNRKGNPPDISKTSFKLKKEDHIARQEDDIIALFNDRKDAMFLSSIHTVKSINTGKRKRGSDKPVVKPEIVDMYNKYL